MSKNDLDTRTFTVHIPALPRERQQLRKKEGKIAYDDRILGGGDFVERVVKEADRRARRQLNNLKTGGRGKKLIEKMVRQAGITAQELRMGGRRKIVVAVRERIAYSLSVKYGMPLAEIARMTGVSTSAIAKTVERMRKIKG